MQRAQCQLDANAELWGASISTGWKGFQPQVAQRVLQAPVMMRRCTLDPGPCAAGLPTSTSASSSMGVDGVPPLMECDPRPDSEAGSLQTTSSTARILRTGSDSSASSSAPLLLAPAPAPDAAAAEEEGGLALDPGLDDPLLEEDVPCGFVFGPFRMRILAYEVRTVCLGSLRHVVENLQHAMRLCV